MVVLGALALLHGELPLLTRLQHLVDRSGPDRRCRRDPRLAPHRRIPDGGNRRLRDLADAVPLLGWWFIGLAAAGFLFCLATRRARAVPLLAGAIALQAAALFCTARSSGAAAPYLSLKMFYLAVYPLMIGAAVMIAGVWHIAARTLRLPDQRSSRLAWALAAIVAIAVARPLAAMPRPRPVVTQPVLDAATWAQSKMPPACIDYLTVDLYTAYWLHLAVFTQPRASGRAMNDDTFDTRKSLERWILPTGLPLGVTDDFEALPRDIRTNVDVLQRFGPAAVVKRRGPSACAQ